MRLGNAEHRAANIRDHMQDGAGFEISFSELICGRAEDHQVYGIPSSMLGDHLPGGAGGDQMLDWYSMGLVEWGEEAEPAAAA